MGLFPGGRCCHDRVFARFGTLESIASCLGLSETCSLGLKSCAPNSDDVSSLGSLWAPLPALCVGVGVDWPNSGDGSFDDCVRVFVDRIEGGVAASDFVGEIDRARSNDREC